MLAGCLVGLPNDFFKFGGKFGGNHENSEVKFGENWKNSEVFLIRYKNFSIDKIRKKKCLKTINSHRFILQNNQIAFFKDIAKIYQSKLGSTGKYFLKKLIFSYRNHSRNYEFWLKRIKIYRKIRNQKIRRLLKNSEIRRYG